MNLQTDHICKAVCSVLSEVTSNKSVQCFRNGGLSLTEDDEVTDVTSYAAAQQISKYPVFPTIRK
jgi:hypothetical protein